MRRTEGCSAATRDQSEDDDDLDGGHHPNRRGPPAVRQNGPPQLLSRACGRRERLKGENQLNQTLITFQHCADNIIGSRKMLAG